MTKRHLTEKPGFGAKALLSILTGAVLLFSVDGARGNVLSQDHPSPEFIKLPPPGKKFKVDDRISFRYEFTAKPRLGTAILRIQIFDKGEKTAAFKVLGRYDMPAMSGAHDSGDQEFKLNKKNDYLLPVNIVMPGEWEVRLVFVKEGEPFFRGFFRFDV